MKFHGNPSIGSRAGACGQTDRQKDRRTHMAQLCDPRTYKIIPWKEIQFGPGFV